MDKAILKKQAAEAAIDHVESGMIVGLGTGTTAVYAVRKLGKLLADGSLERIWGIPTSRESAEQARVAGVPLTTLADHPIIDITIDGADEIDPMLDVIKGGGGALLREKIVAQASKKMIIVGDQSKMVPQLGTGWALPIEVIPFGAQTQIPFLESLGATVTVRRTSDNMLFRTDQSNLILDANFGAIQDAYALAYQLDQRTGIVEHGLFLGLATSIVIAGVDGIETKHRLS